MKRKIPIYIFDEHSMAFFYWHKARYEGFIKQPLDLFHIDAHGDMSRAKKFSKSVYAPKEEDYLKYYRNFAKSELDIGNFIYPSVLNELVKNVYFIFPPWRPYKSHGRRLSVCSVFGEGKILKYGMRLTKKSVPKIMKAYPDIKSFYYSPRRLSEIPQKREVILDIDLDYFACIDTILNHIDYELEITEEQYKSRSQILSDRSIPYGDIRFNFFKKGRKYYAKISHRKVKEEAHLPTEREIESEIDAIVTTLHDKKIDPAVITICRSKLSGHCPQGYCGFIEDSLTKKLKKHNSTLL